MPSRCKHCLAAGDTPEPYRHRASKTHKPPASAGVQQALRRPCLPASSSTSNFELVYLPLGSLSKGQSTFSAKLFDSNNITHLFCTDFYSCRIDNPVGDTRSQGLRRLRLSKLGFDAPVTPTPFLPSVTSPAAATIFSSEFVRSISKQTAVLPTDNAVSL